MDETTIYEDGAIKVTNLRAILGPKTYAMSNVTSVTLAKREPGACLPVGSILFGIAFLLIAVLGVIGLVKEHENITGPAIGILVGAGLIGLGYLFHRAGRTTFIVRVGSASGESNALESQSRETIDKIVAAMNEAIVMKG